ncbi:enoyl-CoA hydratase-related protein [Pseudooceanicola sp.]|uniref:enoyl-CoA hydratase-related protein n=1 Tax=Pseudooceanicola sp. TaxID=1914328 RepID=UPI0026206B1D|nr:enoyl-CoA hydratase-related protein [Pseudooceanicola sp.]MDF1856138.1 enoyl-CoA hydratase-related protein [Pseudooceanicola sp.]
MYENLKTESRGGLRIVTLDRPEAKNAMSAGMTQGLADVMAEYRQDPEVRCVILTGSDGYFCVGGDVKGMAAGKSGPMTMEQKAADLRRRMEAVRNLHEMEKPTISAVEGAAAGAGLGLALACDIRIASATAKITSAFAKVGLSGDYGGSYLASQILGTTRARQMWLMSPILSGQEAADIGLMSEAVPAGTALERALELGEQLANGPTLTYGRMKRNFRLIERGATMGELLDSEAINHALSSQTADHKEAAAAFVAKRAPNFTGS